MYLLNCISNSIINQKAAVRLGLGDLLMDETLIVIMLKDKQTGFLDKELGGYNVGDDDIFIYKLHS